MSIHCTLLPLLRRLFVTTTMLLCLVIVALPGLSADGEAASSGTDSSAHLANFASGIAICTPPITPVELDNPTVVTDCTQAGLQTALDQGGHIGFDCGDGPATIALSTPLQVPGVDTVIDGGGFITLDGQNQTKILENPFVEGGNSLTIQNLRFVNGRAPEAGGDLRSESGAAITSGSPGTRLHILNTTFEENATTATISEDNQGGAIFSNNSYETVIVNSVFRNNRAGSGGAIGGLATGMLIFNTVFRNNQAVDETAGGIVRGYGGALHLDGVTNSFNPDSNRTLHICGSTFEGNTAIRGGGAIGSVVSDNRGTKATFERSTFTNNATLGRNGENGQGGAIYHIEDDHEGAITEDNLAIIDSTFTGNQARRQGGAVWLSILGQGTIVNSTFEGNSTSAPLNEVGQGGAMAITLGLINITNTTFANNHAAYQAGALHGGGADDPQRVITLRNTIFSNNTLNEQDEPSPTEWQGYHTNRPMNDGGNNIQFPRLKPTYENDVNNNITENPIYEDPLLAALADNGGPTLTMALQEGSPAIDAGTSDGCPSTDQRGVSRPQGAGCDIGAYEAGGEPPATEEPTEQPTEEPTEQPTEEPTEEPTDGPVIHSLTPGVIEIDATAALSLTVEGAGFTEASIVRWNGEERPTTFVSATELRVAISAEDVGAVGEAAVTVYDPTAAASSAESEASLFRVVDGLNRVYLPLIQQD